MIQAETVKGEGYMYVADLLSVMLLFCLTPLPKTVWITSRYLLSITIAGQVAGLLP